VFILSAFYDKSGIVIGGTSVSFYKLILISLISFYATDSLIRPVKRQIAINKNLYRMLFVFVAIQTLASLFGNLATNLPVSLPSEIYYFLQRANFLLIPLFAVRYRISPRFVLKLFIAGVLIHYSFIIFQLASPGTYQTFSRMVSTTQLDAAFDWSGDSFDFIGLQRTSNYGAFVAAFGLLALGLSSKRLIGRVFRVVVSGLAIFFVVMGPSRATLVMSVIALAVYVYRIGLLSRYSTYVKVALLAPFAAILLLAGALPARENLASLNAFFDQERTGSNQGKLLIAELGIQLFGQSPIVGYGQRRFADLTLPLGNTNPFMIYTHSYGLSTLLSTGLIGLIAYTILWFMIVRLLMRKRERDYVIICGIFIGLGIYNIVYDAGGLDVFACFNGVAAYYALLSNNREAEA